LDPSFIHLLTRTAPNYFTGVPHLQENEPPKTLPEAYA